MFSMYFLGVAPLYFGHYSLFMRLLLFLKFGPCHCQLSIKIRKSSRTYCPSSILLIRIVILKERNLRREGHISRTSTSGKVKTFFFKNGFLSKKNIKSFFERGAKNGVRFHRSTKERSCTYAPFFRGSAAQRTASDHC